MVEGLLTTLRFFASQGHLSQAFRKFSFIQRHALASASCDFIVDSLSCLLLSCTKCKLLPEGKQLHAQVITWGLQGNHALVPKLVSYYVAFNSHDAAHFVAANTNSQNPLQWNVLISSYVSRGHFEEAIIAYKQMCGKQIRPDNFTYPSVLKACAELSNLDFGKEVHMSINASSLNSNVFVQNALISMYGKCGDLETARSIFNRMLIKDEVSWNSMISEYASKGMWDEAIKIFESMQEAGVESNVVTWNTVAGGSLRAGNFKRALELVSQMRVARCYLDHVAVIIGLGACSHIRSLKLGKEIHGLAIRNSSVDYVNVKNALITLYSRCGDLTHAYIVFRLIEAKNVITWNSIISGFAQWDKSEEATFLFRELLLMDIKPNYVTLASILPLCARVANLKHGKELHCYIARRAEFQECLLLWNALIDTYARSGKVFVARRLFDLLDKRDAVSYTSMINGYGVQGDGKVALKLFEEMIKSQIKPDHIAMVAVLSACSHSGFINQGQLLFEKMQIVYGINPLLEHFSCMVDLYGRAGLLNKAKEIILRMPYKPTSELWATLIGACLIHGNKDIGEWAAEKLLELKPRHSGHCVLISNMYAAAGCWGKLVEVRSFMRDLGVRKDPGCAWVDIGAGFSPFLVEDTSNSQSDEIFLLLRGLTRQMKDVDHAAWVDSEAGEEIPLGNNYSK
ncbi:Tetratricopeptide repeat superfamily protein [Perilla frutescens var. frutescens]|nr:Tetratricopeptide repeat superfamily protein [Perilla frutescens var. frutescens]